VLDFQILLVEDDPFVAEIMTEMVSDFGCKVDWDNTAELALDRLSTGYCPDLILSDIRMPGKSGVELALEVNLRWPNIKIVLMTGFTGEFDRIPEAKRPTVLVKPIDKAILHAVLTKNLS
jgi:CheY-like chemotaxis protein